MVHNVVQPDLIDSLATTHGYSYLLDMFSSPLLQPQQEVVEEMTTEEGNTFQKYLATNCDSNESSRQTSTSVPEETLRQTEGCSKPLDDNFNTNSLGSGQAPDIPKETQAAEPKPPKRPRQKGLTWTQTEHELFLEGMEKYGRGDWKSIANTFVLTRTPAQVASHAQKYFGRLKKAKKPSAGHRGKSMAFKGSLPMTMSIFHPTTCVPPSNYAIVHPTFYVPPSDNGNVPSTYSNPPMDFGNVPLSFTNPLSEESRKVFATNSFPSAGSSTFTLIEPFRPFKFAKVYPTTYVPSSNSSSRVYPTIYVPPLDNNDLSFEDVYQPSMDFITNPTSNNTINHPTTHIPSQDSITAPSSTEINVHPDPFFPLLDFLNDPCLGSTSVPPTNPVTPLNSSFADPEENPTLDFLYAPQLNVDADVQNTLQVPRSVISTSDPTLPMPQNDFGYVEPTVSDPFITEYYTVNHPDSFTSSAAACQTIPISPHDVACMEQMFAEEHFFHENCGFMEFNGM